jgi:hypothetical protein
MVGWTMFRCTVSRFASPSTHILAQRFASTKVRFYLHLHARLSVLCNLQTLKETLQEVIPAKQEQLKQLVRLVSTEPYADPTIL